MSSLLRLCRNCKAVLAAASIDGLNWPSVHGFKRQPPNIFGCNSHANASFGKYLMEMSLLELNFKLYLKYLVISFIIPKLFSKESFK